MRRVLTHIDTPPRSVVAPVLIPAWCAGRVAIEPLITHRIPYAVAAFELVVDHSERSLGMVLTWSEE